MTETATIGFPSAIPRTPSIEAAFDLALFAHAGQTRKGGRIPYVSHPIRVAQRLAVLGCDDDLTICTALLHDAVEDSGGKVTIDTIWDHPSLGRQVATAVRMLTKRSDMTKREYTDSFRSASGTAIICKAADRLDNLEDGFDYDPGREKSYNEESLHLLACIVANKNTHCFQPPYDAAYKTLVSELYAHIGKTLGFL